VAGATARELVEELRRAEFDEYFESWGRTTLNC
jgi:hypothetical protein